MRELAAGHSFTEPTGRIEWYEANILNHYPHHLPLTPFALCLRAATLIEDKKRENEELADCVRAHSWAKRDYTDDNWGKLF